MKRITTPHKEIDNARGNVIPFPLARRLTSEGIAAMEVKEDSEIQFDESEFVPLKECPVHTVQLTATGWCYACEGFWDQSESTNGFYESD
jgi:hypothetical protein